MSEVLVVAPYPPRRCGIGAYAVTQVRSLREAGDVVRVLSPRDGEGDHRVGFLGGRAFLRAVRLGRAADRIVVHFQPALYYRPRRPMSKVLTSLALLWLVVRRPRTELWVHEADRPAWFLRPDYLILRSAFRRARLVFHTEAERGLLERNYRVRVRDAAIVDHADGVTVSGAVTRDEARAALGIGPAAVLFVCPGFLHPDKGLERAVTAFADPGPTALPAGASEGADRRLVILGSVRDRTMANLAYVGSLRDLCERTPGVTLMDRYASDEDFDRWIAAADVVVLPYRRSWSSGVLARARRLGTPALVAAEGGLPEQAGPEDRVFHDDDELARLLREPVGDQGALAR